MNHVAEKNHSYSCYYFLIGYILKADILKLEIF